MGKLNNISSLIASEIVLTIGNGKRTKMRIRKNNFTKCQLDIRSILPKTDGIQILERLEVNISIL